MTLEDAGYTIKISETTSDFCAGNVCSCADCFYLNCPMKWANWEVSCQQNGPCTLYNSLQSCMFNIGYACTLHYGLACSVMASVY